MDSSMKREHISVRLCNSSDIKCNWNLISFIMRTFVHGSSHPEILCKLVITFMRLPLS